MTKNYFQNIDRCPSHLSPFDNDVVKEIPLELPD